MEHDGPLNTTSIKIIVNGIEYRPEVKTTWTLGRVIRDVLKLKGTKISCEVGECGSCTVIRNGTPISSCLELAVRCDGDKIETIEGLAKGKLSILQQSFIDKGGFQCGYCTSGMIMMSHALLNENSNPSETEIKAFLGGNLCRCGAYQMIIEAVLDASKNLRNVSKL